MGIKTAVKDAILDGEIKNNRQEAYQFTKESTRNEAQTQKSTIMILHLRIILDHKKDVFRDIQLDASESLEHLHQTIVAAFDLQKGEMASFFLSNKNWDQEDEIPLLSMQEGSSEMKDISIDVLKYGK